MLGREMSERERQCEREADKLKLKRIYADLAPKDAAIIDMLSLES